QQQLAALRINIELVRERAAEDTALAGRLATIGRDLDTAISDVRSVAQEIYPSLLAREGLRAALAQAARTLGRPVELDIEALSRYAEGVEAAVYFCCVEAMQNAATHAGETATIRVWARDHPNTIRFEVRDDGVGFDTATALHGQGLARMADTIAAVDGILDV